MNIVTPIGPLMKEHRLIEKMVTLLEKEFKKISENQKPNLSFIDDVIDFVKTYADRCHHGKEEDILFAELKKKDISSKHSKILDELINEHIYARKTTKALLKAKQNYVNGDLKKINGILNYIKKLIEFYPKHINKEDKSFFIPVMDYFEEKQQEEMLDKFWEFDKKLIHEKYEKVVEKYES